jgi:hypothetical protein
MSRLRFLVGAAVLLLVACGGRSTPPTLLPPPASIPVSDEEGNNLANQPGPLWVLLSGVDEHGLMAEAELTLLKEPDSAAEAEATVPTGVAAAVYEIRQTGPQQLRRFYRVQTTGGDSGWISDYYVRRVGYLYRAGTEGVSLYESPDGRQLQSVANVTPVVIKEPTRSDWWLVQVVDTEIVGWVPAGVVKESPEREFLQHQQ